MDRNSPHWRRPVIFDPRIGERRLFWNELSDEQRFEELNYQCNKNRGLLARLLKGKNHEHA